ncbi:hypothetical protein [Rubrivirga sp.]|uniref:hypothetical protein n=1 Tax=Rubrivirga sp. TaxID=1885344 RepID=UPI003B52C6E9
MLLFAASACAPPAFVAPSAVQMEMSPVPALDASGFNLDHLDFLGEDVVVNGDTLRLVHIYAEPDGNGGWIFVGDHDEGIACVDDVARAAVVYLRHYQETGDEASRRTAVKLLRFVRHLQTPSGLFYNFVWDRDLTPNTTFVTSVASDVSWWTARAVWALGTGARVLAQSDPAEAAAALAAVRRVEPHLDRLLARYGETEPEDGRPFPQWLIAETGADATSELLLGLVEVERVAPTAEGARRARQFAEGIGALRFGSLAASPWGGHASWVGGWHGWGNSQTQALASGVVADVLPDAALASAQAEARSLYAHLLVEGWLHEITYATGAERAFEQIAYDVRPAAVGLARLHQATGDPDYGVLAGLAAAWFAGDNPADAVMADSAGRGYDGILSPDRVNWNAGAESTIEAQMTLLEVGLDPVAVPWMHARSDPPRTGAVDGRTVRYRVWTADGRRAVVALDRAANTSSVHTGSDADAFLASLAP